MAKITLREGEFYLNIETQNDGAKQFLSFCSSDTFPWLSPSKVRRLYDFIGRWLEKHENSVMAKPRKAKTPRPFTGKLKRGKK
jgi:hypothetical protein